MNNGGFVHRRLSDSGEISKTSGVPLSPQVGIFYQWGAY